MNEPYALVAEFSEPAALIAAARECAAKYRDVDAYAPCPVDGPAEALGVRANRVPGFALLGGLVGATATHLLEWYMALVEYPFNAGDPTFEVMILGAALGCFMGLLFFRGFPRLHRPMFDAGDLDLASRKRFVLSIRATDLISTPTPSAASSGRSRSGHRSLAMKASHRNAATGCEEAMR